MAKCGLCKRRELDSDDRDRRAGRFCYGCLERIDDILAEAGNTFLKLHHKGLVECVLCKHVIDKPSLAQHRRSRRCKHLHGLMQAKKKGHTWHCGNHRAKRLLKMGIALSSVPADRGGRGKAKPHLYGPQWVGLICEVEFDRGRHRHHGVGHIKAMAVRHALNDDVFRRGLQAAARLTSEGDRSKVIRAMLLEALHVKCTNGSVPSCDTGPMQVARLSSYGSVIGHKLTPLGEAHGAECGGDQEVTDL